MTTIVLLTMWTAALTGWANVLYFYSCGVKGTKPNYSMTVKSLVAAIVSLAFGTIVHSLIQSALMSYRMMGL